MSIAFVGLNHKTASVTMRERVGFSDTCLPDALATLLACADIEEAVILSTCNRTEIYASIRDHASGFDLLTDFISSYKNVSAHELIPHLYAGDGLDAATHLFNVVCSLDSLVLGEQQILGQVRKAFATASENGATGKVLNRLFHQALGVGKGVRSETDISKSHVSVSTVAVDLAKRVFEDLDRRTVLVLGAGEMGTLAARYLTEQNVGSVIVTNRTYDRALAVASELGGRASRFDDLVECLGLADIVISSTSASHYLITPQILKRAPRRKGRSLLLIDIAMPRDIDPACERLDDVFLYGMDDLEAIVRENQVGRELAARQAASMVGDEVREFADWLEICDAAPTIQALRERAESIRDAEVARLMKHAKDLDEKDRQSVEAMANALVNKLLHAPIKTLRERAGTADGVRYARAVRDLFNLDESEKR